jgi:hypothetical protein
MSTAFQRPESDFAIEIDFEPETGFDPARVFRSMTQLIDVFQGLDMRLAASVDSSIKPLLMLEDIEAGSLRTWLRNQLSTVDDDVLKQGDWKKVMGAYLVRSRHIIVRWLDGKGQIVSKGDVEELERELLNAAQETEVRQIPAYEPIPRRDLLEEIQNMSVALSHLEDADKASLITAQGKVEFNLEFRINTETIDELTVQESISHEEEMILKVKKPDFIGETKWEFVYERAIEAKIMDADWLTRFQNGDEPISPGDSLRAIVHVDVRYGFEREVVSRDYRITKVIRVLHREKPEQKQLGE